MHQKREDFIEQQMYRPIFVTNSSSSCIIVWATKPRKHNDLKQYAKTCCPHCGQPIGNTQELDDYLAGEELEPRVRKLIADKLSEGYAVFYDIQYLGHYEEDEREHILEDGGYFSFQGNNWYG